MTPSLGSWERRVSEERGLGALGPEPIFTHQEVPPQGQCDFFFSRPLFLQRLAQPWPEPVLEIPGVEASPQGVWVVGIIASAAC